MRFARAPRVAAVAAAFAVATSLAAPVHAAPAETPSAEAAPAPESAEQSGSQQLPIPDDAEVDPQALESLGVFVPALIGSIATRDGEGNLNQDLIDQARALAENPALPPEVTDVWKDLVDFLGAPGAEEAAQVHAADAVTPQQAADPGFEIPRGPRAPRIQQFLFPTIGIGCMPGGNSVGMALTTAGPQQAPAPGPKRGQAGFVYTSLGTGKALNSPQKLWVDWLNIDNGRTGKTALLPNPRINATSGPGTFTGIADTGRGRIIATISGTVTTRTKGQRVACTIIPTVGTAII